MLSIISTVIILFIVLMLVSFRTIPKNITVIDGDTIVVRGRTWRLAGYDSPEYNQPGGNASSAYLRKILNQRKAVGFITGRDIYGRLVVHVFTRRGPLSWTMISAGRGHPESLIGSILCLIARLRKKGIWDGQNVVYSPRLWRQMHGKNSNGYIGQIYRKPLRVNMKYDRRKGLKLPGGFILP